MKSEFDEERGDFFSDLAKYFGFSGFKAYKKSSRNRIPQDLGQFKEDELTELVIQKKRTIEEVEQNSESTFNSFPLWFFLSVSWWISFIMKCEKYGFKLPFDLIELALCMYSEIKLLSELFRSIGIRIQIGDLKKIELELQKRKQETDSIEDAIGEQKVKK